MIDLYAVTDSAGPPLPELASLRAIETGRLAAVCAPVEDRPVTADVLWRHEHVVVALMRDRDVLPFRFGTRVPDAHAAERVLATHYDKLVERLEFVRGAAELSVRVLADKESAAEPATVERPSSGSEYLRARAGDNAKREDALRAVHQPLGAVARAAATRPTRLPAELLSAAYLVDRGEVTSFAALVAQLDEAHPQLRLICTGPWPPYSFAQR